MNHIFDQFFKIAAPTTFVLSCSLQVLGKQDASVFFLLLAIFSQMKISQSK